jgi:cell division septum initiation protein DivIVA
MSSEFPMSWYCATALVKVRCEMSFLEADRRVTSGDEDPSANFKTRLFGFDKDQVRACLQNMARDYAQAVEQITWLTRELKSAEESSREAVRQDITTAQIAQVLSSAHRLADDLAAQAEKSAQQLLWDAQNEAAQFRNQAEADASALTTTANTRLAAIEMQIEQMLEQRASVHEALMRAAARLDGIANDMRQAMTPADESDGRSSEVEGAGVRRAIPARVP